MTDAARILEAHGSNCRAASLRSDPRKRENSQLTCSDANNALIFAGECQNTRTNSPAMSRLRELHDIRCHPEGCGARSGAENIYRNFPGKCDIGHRRRWAYLRDVFALENISFPLTKPALS